jgi:hypothetical protein
MSRVLAKARADTPMVRLRELKKLLDQLEGEGKETRQRLGEQVGRYWHGHELRERRRFPAEQRDRTLYRLNRERVVRSLGWAITEDDFVALQRTIRSERKRHNRLGLPWKTRDPVTGQQAITLTLDLWQLPSYRKHVAHLLEQGAGGGER